MPEVEGVKVTRYECGLAVPYFLLDPGRVNEWVNEHTNIIVASGPGIELTRQTRDKIRGNDSPVREIQIVFDGKVYRTDGDGRFFYMNNHEVGELEADGLMAALNDFLDYVENSYYARLGMKHSKI